jgi:hypothetical protein
VAAGGPDTLGRTADGFEKLGREHAVSDPSAIQAAAAMNETHLCETERFLSVIVDLFRNLRPAATARRRRGPRAGPLQVHAEALPGKAKAPACSDASHPSHFPHGMPTVTRHEVPIT